MVVRHHGLIFWRYVHMHKGRYTLGDKLQQHVAATDHSMCTGRATSCSNKVRRHVAATNRFVCTGEFLWKSFSLQQNFVAAISRKKSNQTESVRLVAVTNSVAATKIFTKILQYTESDLSLQRVTATCCCNLSPSVYLSLIHIWRCRRSTLCRSRWSPYH